MRGVPAEVRNPERVARFLDGSRNGGPLELALLDMDGTLTDELSSWEWLHHRFGVSNEVNWGRYRRGEIDDAQFMRSDVELWRRDGQHASLREVTDILSTAPRMPGITDLVAALRERGALTAIVSGGLDLLAHQLAAEADIDIILANSLHADDAGRLTGASTVRVPIDDKASPTRALVEALGARRERVVAVGNSRWDAGMFASAGFSVAFQPMDEMVQAAADAVVLEKDLRAVVPLLDAYLARSADLEPR